MSGRTVSGHLSPSRDIPPLRTHDTFTAVAYEVVLGHTWVEQCLVEVVPYFGVSSHEELHSPPETRLRIGSIAQPARHFYALVLKQAHDSSAISMLTGKSVSPLTRSACQKLVDPKPGNPYRGFPRIMYTVRKRSTEPFSRCI